MIIKLNGWGWYIQGMVGPGHALALPSQSPSPTKKTPEHYPGVFFNRLSNLFDHQFRVHITIIVHRFDGV
jgi:hypothetical protein